MTLQSNLDFTRKLLDHMSGQVDPEDIASLCSENVSLEIQGDDGALPWIGHKSGRQAIVAWPQGVSALLEPRAFKVEDILESEDRAAVIGSLQAQVKATGKTTTSQFALIVTIADGLICRIQMLEDSFDVSRAVRSERP